MQVDLQRDCDALCECTTAGESEFATQRGCSGATGDGGATEYCTCTACEALVAAEDEPAWAAIEAQVAAASLSRRLKDASSGREGVTSRRLRQRALPAASADAVPAAAAHARSLSQSPQQVAELQANVEALSGVQAVLGAQARC